MTAKHNFWYWVIPGVLAGMPMPFIHPERRLKMGGSLQEFDDELAELHAAGIRAVVTLLNIPSDEALFNQAGFAFLCLPIPDGKAPTIEQVTRLVDFVDVQRAANAAVAVHCEAGLGRTGTMLAAYLVAKGDMPSEAIARVRLAEASAIETSEQAQFLHNLPFNLFGNSPTRHVRVVDSHTGGEPTRVVVGGGPELGGGNVADKLRVFRERYDEFRRAIVNEPRGSDVLVGAFLVEPSDKSCITGVIFFDNVTYLGMCGHGTIGLIVTLAHLGRIQTGVHRIETPVGVITAELHPDGSVSVTNIEAYRRAKAVPVEVLEVGKITGDVAWGGNWFYLVEKHGFALELANVEQLTDISWRIRKAVNAQGYPEVDHIVLLGPPRAKDAHARNFVLCPGKAYDRSPCGTGTSARLACLAADGRLAEGETFVQESILGSRFIGRYRWLDRTTGKIIPTITGTAHVTAEATLLLDERDPFCHGFL